ncbi:hypothetical protein CEXT_489651 [Caerostris extrusa]|uniref:Uncharacterized protein n=1 Tax=Caerostris extrusa TaxID=172846 RepID=A0AAV4Y2H4_CAEEX|nr:hypothetical protein CEXT_489651 [Caerostris extrusa]
MRGVGGELFSISKLFPVPGVGGRRLLGGGGTLPRHSIFFSDNRIGLDSNPITRVECYSLPFLSLTSCGLCNDARPLGFDHQRAVLSGDAKKKKNLLERRKKKKKKKKIKKCK